MLIPNGDLNDLLRQRAGSRLINELLGPPPDCDDLYNLQESQSPTQTNRNYIQAQQVVSQVKSQEQKK